MSRDRRGIDPSSREIRIQRAMGNKGARINFTAASAALVIFVNRLRNVTITIEIAAGRRGAPARLSRSAFSGSPADPPHN